MLLELAEVDFESAISAPVKMLHVGYGLIAWIDMRSGVAAMPILQDSTSTTRHRASGDAPIVACVRRVTIVQRLIRNIVT
jgi:hypothetical protein